MGSWNDRMALFGIERSYWHCLKLILSDERKTYGRLAKLSDKALQKEDAESDSWMATSLKAARENGGEGKRMAKFSARAANKRTQVL